jgi:hypothetical protein
VIGVTAFGRDLNLWLSEGEGWLIIVRIPIRDDEVSEQLRRVDMDRAFCARMHKAIKAGLENAPIGVVTTPGTQNPKYVSHHEA